MPFTDEGCQWKQLGEGTPLLQVVYIFKKFPEVKYPVKSKIPHTFATTDILLSGGKNNTLTLELQTKTNVAVFEINFH